MALRSVSTLKFVGSISVGLLTGLSYTLSTLTLPTLLTLPTATSASHAFTNLTSVSLKHLRTLAGISTSSFLLAYILSPRSQKHPYLLWTSLFVLGSGLTDFVLPTSTAAVAPKPRVNKSKKPRMDASYEVVDNDSNSEGTQSESEEDVNGEEIRVQLEGFMMGQIVRTVVAGLGFAMSVVGIWGDGAVELVVIET